MNAKFVFGPNAGQNIHVPRDQFIDILIRAGVLELGEDSPAPVNAPLKAARFSVGRLPSTQVAIIKISDGRTELFFDGHPSELVDRKFAVAGGVVVPEEIQKQYAAMYNASSLDDQLEIQAETLRLRGAREKQR